MVQIKYKELLLRFNFILLVIFCSFIPPRLCQELEDYEILGEKNVDGTQQEEKNVDYPILTSPNQNEKLNTFCAADFCENIEGYPLDGVNKAIQNLPEPIYQGLHEEFIELGNKMSSDENEITTLCKANQRMMYPQKGNNTNNKEVFIINVPHKKQQVVTWTCSEDNEAGKCGIANFPDGYTGKCVQQYEQINLLIYVNDGGADIAEFSPFKVPSCCSCSTKKISQ